MPRDDTSRMYMIRLDQYNRGVKDAQRYSNGVGDLTVAWLARYCKTQVALCGKSDGRRRAYWLGAAREYRQQIPVASRKAI